MTDVVPDSSPRGAGGPLGSPDAPAKPEQARDATGRFVDYHKAADATLEKLFAAAEANSATPEPGPTGAPAEEESTPDKPDEASGDESDPELEKAHKALKLQGWTDKALAAHSPDELKELATARGKVNSDVGRALQEAAELRKEIEALKAVRATGDADPNGATDDADQDGVKLLSEQFGEDAARAVRLAITAATKGLSERLAQYEQREQSTTRERNKTVMAGERSRLQEAYPQLAGDAAWKALVSVIEGLPEQEARSFKSLSEVFDHAATSIYGEAPNSRAKRQDVSRARSNGQPTPASQRKAPKAMNEAERQQLIFERLDAGATRGQVAAELNRL